MQSLYELNFRHNTTWDDPGAVVCRTDQITLIIQVGGEGAFKDYDASVYRSKGLRNRCLA